jgi:hypothetical protein
MTGTTEQTPGWPWPTQANITRNMDRYFRFLQRQWECNRQLAISWAAAVAPTSRPACRRTRGTRPPTAGHRDLVAEHAHPESEPAGPSAEQTLRRNDLFDSHVDGLIDADIRAATR